MPVMAEYYVIDFRQFHWLRGKISLTCCREQQAGFCQSVALLLWFCGPCEGSTIMLVKMFSDMSCLEDNASRYCKTNSGSIRLINRHGRCDRWLREEDMLKWWVIFTFYV